MLWLNLIYKLDTEYQLPNCLFVAPFSFNMAQIIQIISCLKCLLINVFPSLLTIYHNIFHYLNVNFNIIKNRWCLRQSRVVISSTCGRAHEFRVSSYFCHIVITCSVQIAMRCHHAYSSLLLSLTILCPPYSSTNVTAPLITLTIPFETPSIIWLEEYGECRLILVSYTKRS